jgi:cytochrome c oxidase assembly protein subunit 15
MTVDDFKKIYMWEWSHRILGRLIGMTLVLPTIYFVARGYVAKGSRWKLLAIAGGIGFQGFLGWFMVKSGLSNPEAAPPVIAQSQMNSPVSSGALDPRMQGQASTVPETNATSEWHPRVSQFRLAAHLGTAFLVYLGMLHTGISILREHNVQKETGKVTGWSMSIPGNASRLHSVLSNGQVSRFRVVARALTGLVFVTAMTGALVAGLDAGLVYSEFPYMGEGIVPPKEELLDPRYAIDRAEEGSTVKLVVGNASQNPVTVQFMHRCLAMTSLVSVIGLGIYSRRLSATLKQTGSIALPRMIPRLAVLASLTATMQATLGISTLIYLVPIELASAHQAGSVALLSIMTILLASISKNPFLAWRGAAKRQAVVSSVLRRVQIKQ